MRIALLLLFFITQQNVWCSEYLNNTNIKPITKLSNPPDISVEGGTIDCNNPTIQISVTSTTPGVTYNWDGPNGFDSDLSNPTVDVAGGYIVVATAPDGCTASGVAVVTEDITPPNVYAAGGYMECSEDSIQLEGQSSVPAISWSWQGPNGFTSSEQSPFAYGPGAYILTVTAENGCTKAAQGNVILNGDVPNVLVSGDNLLDCENDTLQLSGSTNSMNTINEWIGPNGFQSTQNDIEIVEPGSYVFSVTSQDGCIGTAEIIITQDTIAPDIQVAGGTLTCDTASLALTAFSNTQNVTYFWQNSNGFMSSDSMPIVSGSGIYELILTAENGCASVAEAVVLEDKVLPNISVAGGVLDCNNDSIQIIGNSLTNNVQFLWEGPNSFSSDLPSPFVSEGGDYTLTLTGENGCTNSETATVGLDFSIPDIEAIGGVLDCIQTNLQLQGSSQTPNVAYAWEGPNSFQSTLQNPTITESGWYTLTVTGLNGCSNITQTMVELNADLPDVSAIGGTINCANPQIEILGNSTTNNVQFNWTGPNSFQSTLQNPQINEGGSYTLTVTGENGCSDTEMVMVIEDFEVPDAIAESDTITCATPEISLSSQSNMPNVIYLWQGPNNFESDLQNPIVDIEGDYFLTITAENGCTNSAMTTVTKNADFPIFSMSADTLTCAITSLPIMVNSMTSNVTFSWQGPNNFESDLQNPMVTDSGNYNLIVTAQNGCSANETIIIQENTEVPDIQVSGGELTCSILEIDLISSSSQSDLVYEWSNSSGIISNDAIVQVSQGGDYELIVTATNGCVNSATANVTLNNEPPQISASGGTLTCAISEIQLMSNSDDSNSTFNWTGPASFVSNEQNPMANQSGNYLLTVIGENDCESSTNISVEENRTIPNINIELPDNLSCANEEVALDATNSDTGANFQFEWSTIDGNISNSDNILTPLVNETGTYSLTILNTDNGCENIESVEVIYDDIGLAGAEILINGPDCFGDENGQISIESVQGGLEPYLYALDGAEFVDTPVFDQLPSGSYQLKIQDVNGCELESDINIPEVFPILTSLQSNAPNGTILLGDSVQLNLEIGLINDEIDTIIWNAEYSNSNCQNCPDPIFKPFTTTNFTAEIITEKGCATETEITIFVDTNRPVFVPNAFSPNGDGINDLLMIYGGSQVQSVNQFVILDRWGQTLFEAQNFSPNDFSNAWDGKFRGETLNSDIFIWFAEIEFIDGKMEMFKGDVMLIH